jgi:hypothetical protein
MQRLGISAMFLSLQVFAIIIKISIALVDKQPNLPFKVSTPCPPLNNDTCYIIVFKSFVIDCHQLFDFFHFFNFELCFLFFFLQNFFFFVVDAHKKISYSVSLSTRFQPSLAMDNALAYFALSTNNEEKNVVRYCQQVSIS